MRCAGIFPSATIPAALVMPKALINDGDKGRTSAFVMRVSSASISKHFSDVSLPLLTKAG